MVGAKWKNCADGAHFKKKHKFYVHPLTRGRDGALLELVKLFIIENGSKGVAE